MTCRSFLFCFNAAGHDFSHNIIALTDNSNSGKCLRDPSRAQINKPTAVSLPCCFFVLVAMSGVRKTLAVTSNLRYNRNKNTNRYFLNNSSCLHDFRRVDKHFRPPFVRLSTPPCGRWRKYFKPVQQLAAEKVEISNWKCTWKRWKSPMQIYRGCSLFCSEVVCFMAIASIVFHGAIHRRNSI